MRLPPIHLVLVAFAVAACGDAPPSLERAIEQSDRYIVVFSNPSAGKAALGAAGAQVVRELPEITAAAAHIPDQALVGLQNNPNIELIEKDPLRQPLAETVPYGIEMVQADLVSDAGTGNRTVCIIDSGYHASHEDLPSGVNVGGENSAAGPWDQDGCGHGTHVAGTVAALGGNGVGVVGVNPSGLLELYIIRVFGDTCSWAYASDLIDAAYRCRDAGADVISMSLGCATGGPFCYSSAEDLAFEDLYENDQILSVAAASNDGKKWYSYPASYDSVISVAALDSNENHASFSNSNDQVELSAPGVGVLSTVPPGCYFCDNNTNLYESWSGTSMATPHVSAVAALVWSHDTSWSNQHVRDALDLSAKDLGSTGRDDDFGYGLVQAEGALGFLGGGTPECETDADCDDANECTTDTCDSGSCSNVAVADETACSLGVCCGGACTSATTCDIAVCGDGVCEGDGEDGMSCKDDCRCAGPNCSKGNCGDGECTGTENTSNCAVDCS